MIAKYARLLGIAAAVAVVGWVMGYGYWRMTITNVLSAVEAQVSPSLGDPNGWRLHVETMSEWRSTGDRSLPFVVELLGQPEMKPAYQSALCSYYIERVNRIAPRDVPDDWRFTPTDPPETRDRVIEAIRVEWRNKWEPRFKWWNWWTGEALE